METSALVRQPEKVPLENVLVLVLGAPSRVLKPFGDVGDADKQAWAGSGVVRPQQEGALVREDCRGRIAIVEPLDAPKELEGWRLTPGWPSCSEPQRRWGNIWASLYVSLRGKTASIFDLLPCWCLLLRAGCDRQRRRCPQRESHGGSNGELRDKNGRLCWGREDKVRYCLDGEGATVRKLSKIVSFSFSRAAKEYRVGKDSGAYSEFPEGSHYGLLRSTSLAC
ncbi:hypothetical protein VTG60DRAFT_3930 [Thermothelomyces hinnuleus]